MKIVTKEKDKESEYLLNKRGQLVLEKWDTIDRDVLMFRIEDQGLHTIVLQDNTKITIELEEVLDEINF